MVSKVFYSSITGKPLENPVVFDGWLCDRTEADKILSLSNPVLDNKNNIVEAPASSSSSSAQTSLGWVRNALSKHNGRLISANFLQPIIDAAYNESAWPRPSALREHNLVMKKESADHVSQPEVLRAALSSLFENTIKQMDPNSLIMEVSATPKNKRYAAVLNKYGVISRPNMTQGNDPKMTIADLDLKTLIGQAESARVMMLNMRRVLMSKPKNLVMTADVILQQKLINAVDVLDKPLMHNGDIQQTASIQDALTLLDTFIQVQNNSTNRIYSSDKARAWHMLVAENEQYAKVDQYIDPFQKAYKKEIDVFTTYSNADDLIKQGELARRILLQLKSLSEKQEDMGFDYVPGHNWSSELQEQRALVDSLGSQADDVDINASIQKRLSESLLNNTLSKATRVERAKIYTDTLKAIYDVSRRVLTTSAYVIKPKAGEMSWHNMIALEDSFNPKEMYKRVEEKASGIKMADPDFTFQTIANPFEDYVSRNASSVIDLSTCSLNGHPTQVPVIFLDGYVYDGNALHAYLSAGNTKSPVTGEDFAEIIKGWNLSDLSTLLPVSRALTESNVQAKQQGNNDGFMLASAPPAVDYWTKLGNPQPYTASDSEAKKAQKDLNELQGLIPLDGKYVLTNDIITITPQLHPEHGVLGRYDYYHYDNKKIYWKEVQENMTEQCEYLKEQGIISGYSFSTGDAPKQVMLFGFSQESLLQKANNARKMLVAVKAATEVEGLFNRRLASIPVIKSAQRSGMNPLQDNGELPLHVHYQHRNIVGDSSRLSKQTRNSLSTEIDPAHLRAAFECLACAKEVIGFGAQGARNNNTSYLRPLTYLRTDATRDWYKIFQSNIEKRYTSYGHYEATKAMPYNFEAMERGVNQWAQNNKPVDSNRLSASTTV